MDSQDFEMPSPKRQKTDSPTNVATLESMNEVPSGKLNEDGAIMTATATGPVSTKENEGMDMLDTLMQHVNAESLPISTSHETTVQELQEQHIENMDQQTVSDPMETTAMSSNEAPPNPAGQQPHPQDAKSTIQDTAPIDPISAGHEDTPVAPGQEEREWETDSSPYDSSSDTSTDSSDEESSDNDEDNADEYILLDPYEQARILMADGGGDDDDDAAGNSSNRPAGNAAGLRTANEKLETAPPKPDITITPDIPIEELGVVDMVLASELTLLVKAKVSGEYRVLEGGSLLCLHDRTVVGVVAEPLGRVEQPLYVVQYATMQEMKETFAPRDNLSEPNGTDAPDVQSYDVTTAKGTKIFYVPSHSTFVFTQPLRSIKGSDASNFHDEEVGDDELEFSDDEAEAEHKRALKLRRRGIDPASVPAAGRGRGANRGRGRNSMHGGNSAHAVPQGNSNAYGDGSLEMDYDGGETPYTDTDGYRKLERPRTGPDSNESLPPAQTFSHNNSFNSNHSRGSFRGRGRGRGGHDSRGRTNHRGTYQNTSFSRQPANSYQMPSLPPALHQTMQQQALLFSQMGMTQAPPPPPTLSAQFSSAQQGQFSPSPITPLPQGSFNFGFGAQQQQSPGGMNWNMNADAVAQVQRHLEELRRQNYGQGRGRS